MAPGEPSSHCITPLSNDVRIVLAGELNWSMSRSRYTSLENPLQDEASLRYLAFEFLSTRDKQIYTVNVCVSATLFPMTDT